MPQFYFPVPLVHVLLKATHTQIYNCTSDVKSHVNKDHLNRNLIVQNSEIFVESNPLWFEILSNNEFLQHLNFIKPMKCDTVKDKFNKME